MDSPTIEYATTSDGYKIAYAVSGNGHPVLLINATFGLGSHGPLESQHMVEALSARYRLIRCDPRGQGLSARGLPEGHTFESYRADIEAVLDKLALPSVMLISTRYCWRISVQFAKAHPERVSGLVMSNAEIPAMSPGGGTSRHAFEDLARISWRRFCQMVVSSAYIPPASVREFQAGITQEDMIKVLRAIMAFRMAEVLPSVRVPALLIWDARLRLGDNASEIARLMPDARLALLDGEPYLASADGTSPAMRHINGFIDSLPEARNRPAVLAPKVELSRRQGEVLRLISQGKTNREIADALVLSERTVERHISALYGRLEVRNRTEAASYAHQYGLA